MMITNSQYWHHFTYWYSPKLVFKEGMNELPVSMNGSEWMMEEDQSMALKWSNPVSLQHGAWGNSHECGYLLHFTISNINSNNWFKNLQKIIQHKVLIL